MRELHLHESKNPSDWCGHDTDKDDAASQHESSTEALDLSFRQIQYALSTAQRAFEYQARGHWEGRLLSSTLLPQLRAREDRVKSFVLGLWWPRSGKYINAVFMTFCTASTKDSKHKRI